MRLSWWVDVLLSDDGVLSCDDLAMSSAFLGIVLVVWARSEGAEVRLSVCDVVVHVRRRVVLGLLW